MCVVRVLAVWVPADVRATPKPRAAAHSASAIADRMREMRFAIRANRKGDANQRRKRAGYVPDALSASEQAFHLRPPDGMTQGFQKPGVVSKRPTAHLCVSIASAPLSVIDYIGPHQNRARWTIH